jgi:hypothetical protein
MWTALALGMWLAGCASGGGTNCGPWKPVYVSSQDVLTDGTARSILAHNEAGRALCGW